jgi:hypothetical protein
MMPYLAKREVRYPLFAAGMKEWNDGSILWINTRKIWTFVQVAVVTGKCKIFWIVIPTVLLRDNMINMKQCELHVLL